MLRWLYYEIVTYGTWSDDIMKKILQLHFWYSKLRILFVNLMQAVPYYLLVHLLVHRKQANRLIEISEMP